jgi:hypothetical protein
VHILKDIHAISQKNSARRELLRFKFISNKHFIPPAKGVSKQRYL